MVLFSLYWFIYCHYFSHCLSDVCWRVHIYSYFLFNCISWWLIPITILLYILHSQLGYLFDKEFFIWQLAAFPNTWLCLSSVFNVFNVTRDTLCMVAVFRSCVHLSYLPISHYSWGVSKFIQNVSFCIDWRQCFLLVA